MSGYADSAVGDYEGYAELREAGGDGTDLVIYFCVT